MLSFKLRPHHALCMQFFQGKGYSEGFTENMYYVINQLKSDTEIEIVSGADILCSCCPNLEAGDGGKRCKSFEAVNSYDNAVCRECGFSYGDVVTARDFFYIALEKIIIPGKMPDICGDCQWSELCKNPV